MIDKHNCDCDKYCNLNNRIIDHVNNNTIHVTKDDKDTWNGKISKDQLDQTAQDLRLEISNTSTTVDNKLKGYLKVSDMIKYSTLEYVNSELLKLNKKCDGYASSDEVDTKYNALFDTCQKTSSLLTQNYYTKKDIDSKITNKDYTVTDLSVNGNVLSLTLGKIGQLSVKLPISGSDYDDSHILELLKNYALLNNRKTITFKSGSNTVLYDPFGNTNRTISLDSSANVGKYITYYQNTTSNTVVPLTPDSGKLPSDYASSTDQGKWNRICPVRNSGEYTWQVLVYMNSENIAEDWTSPICITSKDGLNGIDTTGREYIYKLATNETYSNITTPTESQDVDGFVPDGWTDKPSGITEDNQYEMFCYRDKANGSWSEWKPLTPLIWSHFGENGIDGDGFEYIYYATNGSIDLTSNVQNPLLWYDNTQSKLDVNKTLYNKEQYILQGSGWAQDPIDLTLKGQGWKCYVSTRRRYADAGTKLVYWHQFTSPVLWSYYAADGVQELKGSPLRDKGEWVTGTTYYDGTIAVNNVFYQDFVLYNNTYYACIDTQIGLSEAWAVTPDKSKAFAAFSMNDAMFANMLIANKANIKELSAGEIVIMDDNEIVAGMTSSKAVTLSSDLYNKVDTSGKGNVRIWAGTISNGQLNSAPFYVTSDGKMVATKGTIANYTISTDGLSYGVSGKTNHLKLNGSGLYLNIPSYGSSLAFGTGVAPSTGLWWPVEVDVHKDYTKYDSVARNTGIRINVYGNIDKSVRFYNNDNVPMGNHAIEAESGDYAGFRPYTRYVNSSLTIQKMDNVISCLNAEGTNITLTLPSDAEIGQWYRIIKWTGGVTIKSGSSNILLENSSDDYSNIELTGKYTWCELIYNGNYWFFKR